MHVESGTKPKSFLLNSLVFLYVFSVLVLPDVPVLSRSSLLFSIMIGFILLIRFFRTGRLPLFSWILIPFGFSLYAISSIFWSTDQAVATLSAVTLISAIGGSVVVGLALLSGCSWHAVVSSCFVSGLVIIASAIPEIMESTTNLRASGIVGNPNLLAMHLTIAAFVLLAADRKKWFYGGSGILFVLFATFASGSIKMLLFWGIFSIYGIIQLHIWSNRSFLRKFLLTGGYLLLTIFILLVGSFVLNNLEDLTVAKRFFQLLEGSNDSGTTRMDMIGEALFIWSQKPLFGNGIDQFRVLGSYGTYSHNNYAEMLADFGLVATAFYYVRHLVLLYFSLKGLHSSSSKYLLVAVFTSVTLLWDFGLVSYVEKSIWLMAMISFYILQTADSRLQKPVMPVSNPSQFTKVG